MEVRPLLVWVLSTTSALMGALLGTFFEGILDNYLLGAAIGAEDWMHEAFSTVIGSLLAAVVVGLISAIIFVGYQRIFYGRE